MSATVLVTGANGYIGRKLCEALSQNGEQIRVVLREQATGPWHEVIEADLLNKLPDNIMSNIQTVFHLAGKAHALDAPIQDEQEYLVINADATKNLLLAAEIAGVENFIYFSSVKALRETTDQCLDEKAEPMPLTAYGRSKLLAEKYVLESNLKKSIVLRLGMVYGPNCKGNLPRLIKMAKNRFVPALPKIQNQRSMVSIGDVVDTSILLANSSEVESSIFHLTEPVAYSTNDIMAAIYAGLEKQPPRFTVPLIALKTMATAGDMITKISGKQFFLNTAQLQKVFGSACYSSQKLQNIPGVTLKNRLHESMPDIIESL